MQRVIFDQPFQEPQTTLALPPDMLLHSPGKAQRFRERYLEIFGAQCGICASVKNLHIDHDHVSGLVRGVLCRRCNWVLGVWEKIGFTAEKWIAGLKQYLQIANDVEVNTMPRRHIVGSVKDRPKMRSIIIAEDFRPYPDRKNWDRRQAIGKDGRRLSLSGSLLKQMKLMVEEDYWATPEDTEFWD